MISCDAWEPEPYITAIKDRCSALSVSCSTLHLNSGDYSWPTPDGRVVLVERKTAADLIHSLGDTRWATQVPRLIESADVPIILIEGNILYHPDGTVAYEGQRNQDWTIGRVDGTIVVAELAGVVVSRCASGPASTASRILGLYDLTRREEHSSLVSKRRVKTNKNELIAVGMLCVLPGLGETTARRLLTRYGSFKSVIDAILIGSMEHKNAALWQDILSGAKSGGAN